MEQNNNTAEERIIVPIDEHDTEKCRVLWLAVIMQNLSDGLNHSDKYPFKQRRIDALKWFEAEEGEGSDFAMVCDLAGIDFERTKKRIDGFISGRLNSIDFRCLRKSVDGTPNSKSRREYLTRQRRTEESRAKKVSITPGMFFDKQDLRETAQNKSWREKLKRPAA